MEQVTLDFLANVVLSWAAGFTFGLLLKTFKQFIEKAFIK